MFKRLPNPQAILQVYAVIAVMLSGWTITAFLWKLSAWLLVLNLGEILTIFSYAMVTDLLESLSLLLLLLMFCALLPTSLLRDNFAVRGAVLSIGFIGSLMSFVGLHMQFGTERRGALLIGLFEILVLTSVLLGFLPKFHLAHSAVLWVSDRLIVFLYILIPLFVILLGYVIFRNIT